MWMFEIVNQCWIGVHNLFLIHAFLSQETQGITNLKVEVVEGIATVEVRIKETFLTV